MGFTLAREPTPAAVRDRRPPLQRYSNVSTLAHRDTAAQFRQFSGDFAAEAPFIAQQCSSACSKRNRSPTVALRLGPTR